MTPPVITPKRYSPHIKMFRNGYQGDESLLRRASIGGQFDEVRQLLSIAAFDSDIDAAVQYYKQELQDSLETAWLDR
jgi:hypothetical protein